LLSDALMLLFGRAQRWRAVKPDTQHGVGRQDNVATVPLDEEQASNGHSNQPGCAGG
jgi:hypothetical protein